MRLTLYMYTHTPSIQFFSINYVIPILFLLVYDSLVASVILVTYNIKATRMKWFSIWTEKQHY